MSKTMHRHRRYVLGSTGARFVFVSTSKVLEDQWERKTSIFNRERRCSREFPLEDVFRLLYVGNI